MPSVKLLLMSSDEYDILPVKDSTTNRNPIYVVDHKLAIESWAAKLMLTAASTLLRRFKEKAQKPTTSGEYN